MISHYTYCSAACFFSLNNTSCRSVIMCYLQNYLTLDPRDTGLIPELGRWPAVGNGNLPQYSCLKNPMDRGACQATVQGVAESDIPERLSMHTQYSLDDIPPLCNSSSLLEADTSPFFTIKNNAARASLCPHVFSRLRSRSYAF